MEQSGEQVLVLVSFCIYARRSPKLGSEEAPIYIVQSERTANSRSNSRRKMIPSTEESAGHKRTSRHALAVSARSLAVGSSEIYALLLNNG